MTDEIELLREARPVAAGPTPELARQRRDELMMRIEGRRERRKWKLRSFPIAVPSLVAVAAAVVVGVTLLGRGGDSAWAAPLVKVAETAPRLLLDQPDWRVTRADEFSVELGEMTFANGDHELELRWQPVNQYRAAVDKRAMEADVATTMPVPGAEARLFRYRDSNVYSALWARGRYSIEVVGSAPDVETFKAELASLREVDVDTWLSAMPASVVTPASRAEVVRQMLADVTLPAGFDAAALERGSAFRDRYQLGAQVAGAVACAWIDQWVTARRAGNDAEVRQAVGAMSTSRQWSILQEMNDDGDYSEVLWDLADAMATNAPIAAGKPLTVEESYGAALGCAGS